MDCPHCRAPLPESAAACPACGVDLVKLKAKQLLAKLKQARGGAESAAPPWTRSALFLGALGAGACLLLYGATLVLRRSAAPAAPQAATSEPDAASAAVAPGSSEAQPSSVSRPSAPPPPVETPSYPVGTYDGKPGSRRPPPPPATPR